MAVDEVSREPVSELPVTWEPDEKCRRPANGPEARRSQSHSQKACGDQLAQFIVCFSEPHCEQNYQPRVPTPPLKGPTIRGVIQPP